MNEVFIQTCKTFRTGLEHQSHGTPADSSRTRFNTDRPLQNMFTKILEYFSLTMLKQSFKQSAGLAKASINNRRTPVIGLGICSDSVSQTRLNRFQCYLFHPSHTKLYSLNCKGHPDHADQNCHKTLQ